MNPPSRIYASMRVIIANQSTDQNHVLPYSTCYFQLCLNKSHLSSQTANNISVFPIFSFPLWMAIVHSFSRWPQRWRRVNPAKAKDFYHNYIYIYMYLFDIKVRNCVKHFCISSAPYFSHHESIICACAIHITIVSLLTIL